MMAKVLNLKQNAVGPTGLTDKKLTFLNVVFWSLALHDVGPSVAFSHNYFLRDYQAVRCH